MTSSTARMGAALLPKTLSFVSIIIGAVVLIGWAAEQPSLTTFMPERSATQPLSALMIILTGAALTAWTTSGKRWLTSAFAIACLAISIAVAIQHVTATSFGIDGFFFGDAIRDQATYAHPGRPSLPTVFAFAALAIAILAVPDRSRGAGLLCSVASTIGVVITLISGLSHFFGVTGVSGALGFTQMALPTTLGAGAISVAILACRTDAGWVSLLVGSSVGATVGRWLLPTIMIVPVAVTWAAYTGHEAGLYSATFRMVLITTTTVVLLAAFTLWGAAQLDQLEVVLKAAEDLRRSEANLRAAEARQRVLANELKHRVKNTLTVVQAIAHQTFKQGSDYEKAMAAFSGRLQSLSGAHDILVSDEVGGSSLRQIVQRAIDGGCGFDPKRIELSGPDLELPSRPALAMSMIIHELCTNAVKYGALSNDRGTITIQWRLRDTGSHCRLDWSWRERGGPPVTPPSQTGFGSKLIKRILATDLEGKAEMDFSQEGLSCEIVARLEKSAQPLSGLHLDNVEHSTPALT